MEKLLLQKFFKRIANGSLDVTFWDGTTQQYGNGDPTCKVILREPLDYKKIIEDPVLAFGESYVRGLIEVKGDLEELLKIVFCNHEHFLPSNQALEKAFSLLRRVNSVNRRKTDVQYHYDLGNEFFSLWLDETLSYSCAYFHSPEDSLYQAQLQKIDLILKKLQLQPGDTLLDIGSGWGWLIIRAAQQYQVKAMGVTLSQQQYQATKERIEQLGLKELVTVELIDYQTLAKNNLSFNKIVSVGMLEHVGKANLSVYMQAVDKLLAPRGLSLIHTITAQKEEPVNAWIEKYIFPGGYIPSYRELVSQLPDFDFHLIDMESLRLHYAMTLDHWAQRFEKSVDEVTKMYDEAFVRKWRLYLRSCAASFRYNGLDIHQFLFSKGLINDLPLTRHHLCENC